MRYRSPSRIQAWKVVLPASRRISRVLRYSGVSSPLDDFAYGALTLSGWLSSPLLLSSQVVVADPQPRRACSSVWPLSLSLAATQKIAFAFFSSGYLDVSVPRVPSVKTMDSSCRVRSSAGQVPPFGYPRIYARLQLPVAFRSWPRPSSAYGALASTLCSL